MMKLESQTYLNSSFTTYFADSQALITVFIDGTERSPTFRLDPLDTTLPQQPRKSLFRVQTPCKDSQSSWKFFKKGNLKD